MNNIVIQALRFAADKHKEQRRTYEGQRPIPYLNHPIEVMHILAVEAGIENDAVLAAALLHDTLEDTSATVEELVTLFGPKIMGLVMELTDDQTVSLEERYAAQLRKTPTYSHEAKLVKLADRIANLRDAVQATMPGWTEARRFGHFLQGRKQVDTMQGTHAGLEQLYNEAYRGAQALMDAK